MPAMAIITRLLRAALFAGALALLFAPSALAQAEPPQAEANNLLGPIICLLVILLLDIALIAFALRIRKRLQAIAPPPIEE